MATLTIGNAAFEPGTVVARPLSLTTGQRWTVVAGPAAELAWFPSRHQAFKAAYTASLGPEAGALLVGKGAGGFSVQPALAREGDSTMPLRFEAFSTGDRPVLGRGDADARFEAILDGAAMILAPV